MRKCTPSRRASRCAPRQGVCRMLRPIVVRFVSGSLLVCLAFASCTPEAVLVDAPPGGSAGSSAPGGAGASDAGAEAEGGSGWSLAGSAATGGSGGGAGMTSAGGAPGCAPISSDRPGCAECLADKCAPQVAACDDNECTCGDWNGSLGQFNCLLDCPNFPGMKSQVDQCAATCGFQDIMHMAQQTHALFDCLIQPPSGPLACDQCAPPPPQ